MTYLSIIIGPPLSGKTTFIQSLSGQSVVHISVGKICRDEAKKDTRLGRILQKSIQENTFLDSEMLLSFLLDDKLKPYNAELILDGYPKYEHEIKPLLQYVKRNSIELCRLYRLHVTLKELLRRLHKRYTCSSCYLPINGNVQCRCGGIQFKREEDTEEYFLDRYSRYLKHAEAVMEQLHNHFMEVINV